MPNTKIFLIGDLVYDQINRQNTRLLQRSVAMLHVDGGMMDERARSIDRSLVQAGLVGAWEAYQALHAPPYRDELFRYMALWSEGGIYMDGRLLLRGPVELWASLDEGQTLSICSDRSRTFTSQRTGEEVPVLWNGAFSAKKNSPVLLESIRRIVETVRQRSYYLDGEEEAIGNLTHRAAGVTGSLVLSLVSLRLRDQVRIPCIYKGPRHGIFEPEDQGTQWRGRSWDRQLGEFEPHLFRRQKKKGKDYGWWFEERLLYAENPDDASERDGGKGP